MLLPKENEREREREKCDRKDKPIGEVEKSEFVYFLDWRCFFCFFFGYIDDIYFIV